MSHVKDSSTLICRKPSQDNVAKYVEEELLDGLCCYSAVNQGQLNQTIVDAVVHHLQEEKIPTVPRSIRHKYMSGFLLASTAFTEMDRVVPKVAGVESWELTFKLCRRWGYEVKKIPKGKTRSYQEIAVSVGKPNSARAVANACGKNPYPITIPCHRVIKSNGDLGGYSAKGGVKKKRILLSQEIGYSI